jgi:hypothetical protein
MPFVITNHGLVNLTHVGQIIRTSDRTITFYSHDGEHILGQTTADSVYQFEQLLHPVIPAAPQQAAYLIAVHLTDRRPHADDLFIQRKQVIAWRVSDDCASPCFVEPPAINQTVLTINPDGSLSNIVEGDFNSLDEAKKHFLTEAQEQWDADNKAA